MSKAPTRFEITEAKDMIRLQEEVEREDARVKSRSTKNEEKASKRVEAERRGDSSRIAEIDARDEQLRAQKRRERREYLARKCQAEEARNRRICDPTSDRER